MFATLIRKAQTVLCTALVLSCALIFSAPQPALAASPVAVSVTTASAEPGGTVALTVNVADNPGFAGLNFTVSYDKSVLTLTSIAPTGLLAGKAIVSDASVNDNFTFAQVTNVTGDGSLVTLNFSVASSAPEGSYAVSVGIKDGAAANFISDTGTRLSIASSAGAVSVSNNSGSLITDPGNTGSSNTGSTNTGTGSTGANNTNAGGGVGGGLATTGTGGSSNALGGNSTQGGGANGNATNALGDAATPLGGGTSADQQGSISPQMTAVIIALVVVILAVALWLLLRRRRKQPELLVDEQSA